MELNRKELEKLIKNKLDSLKKIKLAMAESDRIVREDIVPDIKKEIKKSNQVQKMGYIVMQQGAIENRLRGILTQYSIVFPDKRSINSSEIDNMDKKRDEFLRNKSLLELCNECFLIHKLIGYDLWNDIKTFNTERNMAFKKVFKDPKNMSYKKQDKSTNKALDLGFKIIDKLYR